MVAVYAEYRNRYIQVLVLIINPREPAKESTEDVDKCTIHRPRKAEPN